jgi:hypothetical protein
MRVVPLAAGMVTGEIKAKKSESCVRGCLRDICPVSGVTHWQTPSHEPENGSLILTPGVDTTAGPKRVKRGPFKPSQNCGAGSMIAPNPIA